MTLNLKRVKKITSKFEPWHSIIFAPIWQELLFRYLPYQYLYLKDAKFWEVGIISSISFAVIHWYFGWRFVVLTFIGGLILWIAMVNYGLVAAILLHGLINMAGWRHELFKKVVK